LFFYATRATPIDEFLTLVVQQYKYTYKSSTTAERADRGVALA